MGDRHRQLVSVSAAAVVGLAVLLPASGLLAGTLDFAGPEGTWLPRSSPLRFGLGLLAIIELLVLVALALPGAWKDIGRHFGRPSRRELLALGGLTLAAAAVRFLLSPPAALLSTFNDVKHAHDAMCLAGQASACGFSVAYPLGATGLHSLVLLLTGPSLEAMYVTNAVLSALTVPLAWGLGTLLFDGRRLAGWLLAVGVAGLPLSVRFAATGALSTPFAFLATLALTALLLVARTHRLRHLWLAGLAATLAAQTRFEGPYLLVVLLAASLFLVPSLWPLLFQRRHRASTVLLLVLLAATCLDPVLHVADDWQNLREDGMAMLHWKVTFAVAGPLILWGASRLLDRLPGGRFLRWPVGLVLAGLVAYAIGNGLGTSYFPTEHWFSPGPWAAFSDEGLLFPSYAESGIPLLNPRGVPVHVIGLFFLGIAAGMHPRRRKILAVMGLWVALATALGTQKHTGSLPYEGLRTAVGGAVPFVGLAVLGVVGVIDAIPKRFAPARKVVAGVCALSFALLPLLSLPMLTDRDFNNERQIRFLARELPRLPPKATVVFPSFSAPGQPELARLFHIPELWWTVGRTGGRRDDTFVTAESAVADSRELLALAHEDAPVLFWEGLACWRTAVPDLPRPDCAEMHRTFVLTSLATETLPNRPFESDFMEAFLIAGDEVRLTIYRVDGRRPAGEKP